MATITGEDVLGHALELHKVAGMTNPLVEIGHLRFGKDKVLGLWQRHGYGRGLVVGVRVFDRVGFRVVAGQLV